MLRFISFTALWAIIFPLSFICSDSGNTLHNSKISSPSPQKSKRFNSPGIVPNFMAHFPESYQNCYPGISDPGLDTAQAIQQALKRAAIIHALSKKTDISFMTDYYTKNIRSRKWEVFVNMFRIPLKVSKMTPDTVFFTQFGEAVVAASPQKGFLEKKDLIVLSGFIQEKSYRDISDYIYRYEIEENEQTHCIIRVVNNNFGVESTLEGSLVKYPLYNYHYQSIGQSVSEEQARGFKLTSGLWPAYYSSIMKTVFLKSKATADYYVGNLRDSYSKDLNAKLKRQSGRNTFSLRYLGCQIDDNYFTPTIEITTKP